MKDIKIIRIFLIFAALYCCNLSADVQIYPKITLDQDHSGNDANFLRNAVRVLINYRNISNSARNNEELSIYSNSKKFYYDEVSLKIPGNSISWESNIELRKNIYAYLAIHIFNLDVPEKNHLFPAWITLAIDAEAEKIRTAGEFIKKNRTSRLMADFYSLTETLPDFISLCQMENSGDEVLNLFVREQSRVLLEIISENRKIKELFEESLKNPSSIPLMKWYDDRKKAQFYLLQDAENIIYNNFSPVSPENGITIISQLEEIDIFENEKSGKIIRTDWKNLEKILSSGRKDADSIRKTCSDLWRKNSSFFTLKEREICFKIASTVDRFGIDENAFQNFSLQKKKLISTLELRKKQERFFHDTLDRYIPLPVRFKILFDAAEYENRALSDEQKKYFNSVIDSY